MELDRSVLRQWKALHPAKGLKQRDPGLSEYAREAVIAAIADDATTSNSRGANQAAATLAAQLDQTSVLTAGERHLLKELRERIANSD